jgi:hypothetical protein
MLGDRDIFAGDKGVPVELEGRLVVVGAGGIGEHPAILAQVQQSALLRLLSFPEPEYPAGAPVFMVEIEIKMPVFGQRCSELVTAARIAFRKLLRPGEFQADLLQRCGHDRSARINAS